MRSCSITLALCFAFALVSGRTLAQEKKTGPAARTDRFGDPLPAGAIARIGTVRYRLLEGRYGQGSALSPDGKLLAVVGMRGDIEYWELPAWKKKAGRSPGFNRPPQFSSLAFSADSKRLVALDYNQFHVHLLDVATGKSVKKLVLERKKNANNPQVSLSRNQKIAVCSFSIDMPNSRAREMQVWDVDQEKRTLTFQLPMNRFDGRFYYVVSPDGRWLAQSGVKENAAGARWGGGRNDLFIEFWDLKTGKTARTIDVDQFMQKLAFSPDGKWLAASNGQSVLRIYSAADGKERHNIRLRRGSVNTLEFSPDSASLFLTDFNGKVTRWDPVSGELKATHTGPPNAAVRQLAFAPDGKIFALAHSMDALAFWEVTTGKVLSPTNVPTSTIGDLKFMPNGELFLSCEDGGLAFWNPRTAVKVRDLKLQTPSPNYGNMIYYDDMMGMPGGFGMGGGFGGRSYYPRRGGNASNTLSPGGHFLVTNTGNASVYDAKTGKPLYDDDASRGAGERGNIAFFDGDAKAASIGNKQLRVWDARSGRDLARYSVPLRDQETAIRFAASPRGKQFAIATADQRGQGRVILWDVDQKKIAREWPTQDRQDALTFSPDQQWLAIAGSPNRLLLAQVGARKGDYYLPLTRSVVELSQLAFSPDGRQIACAAILPGRGLEDGRIVIYEIASKKIRLELPGHPNAIIDRLAYSRDSNLLASGASDTTVVVWQAGLRAYADTPSLKSATDAELADRFKQMAGADAERAFRGMIELARTPMQTVKLLDAKIAPAQKPSSGEKTIGQWIQDLGSGRYAVRTRATTMLRKIGPSTEPELRAALAKTSDVETKRRLEELLTKFSAHEWTAEEVLHSRAVEVLEAVGTPQARAVLTHWTSGDGAAILTQQARQALARAK